MLTLKITIDAYRKLRYFTDLCETEISGLGKVKEIDVNVFEIIDIEIFKQETSSIHSTLCEESLAKFLNEKIKKNENISDYKIWWHSHVNMNSFFSAMDEKTIEQSTEFPYLISIVTNKNEEDIARIDFFKPRLILPMNIKISLSEDIKTKEICQKEIEEKIKEISWEKLILKDKKKSSTLKYSKKL